MACGSESDDDKRRSSGSGQAEADDDDPYGSSGAGGSSGYKPNDPSDPDRELPWEVVSDQGETLLPNVYYADRSQNAQVMPHTIDFPTVRHAQIDRLVYPTLGNPNLFSRDDETDSLMVVMRVEDVALEHLNPQLGEAIPNTHRHRLSLDKGNQDRLQIYLVPRAGRDTYTTLDRAVPGGGGDRLYRIEPSDLQIDDLLEDLPAILAERRTLRFWFRHEALAHVPAGLYDIRFEIQREGRLATDSTGEHQVEWQYNAVSIQDDAPEEYTVLNVTDTQVSMANVGTGDSRDQLRGFVRSINTSIDPSVRSARFITFNGDLHNGGSALTLRQNTVAHTYRNEATFIVEALRDLNKPIFLTAGNHDGYAATGIAPGAVVYADSAANISLAEVVRNSMPSAWPGFTEQAYGNYRSRVANTPGGFPLDVYTGTFRRTVGARTYSEGWHLIPERERNMMLYDGFSQWHRTYGPLHYSFNFGKNHYISGNSYDLRQHTRAGWGMYTVNYGGGLSAEQEEWLGRDLRRNQSKDTVLLMHHDPRGGHKGEDQGYYFAQLAFANMQQSLVNFVLQQGIGPTMCKLPRWARAGYSEAECLHDGLQEWMAPDLRFDCGQGSMRDGACAADLIDDQNTYRFDAYRLIDLIARTPQLRTMMLGHRHLNALEVRLSGDELVRVNFTDEELRRRAELEVQNPARGYAWQVETSGQAPDDYDPEATDEAKIEARLKQMRTVLQGAANGTTQILGGERNRELVILHTTSVSNLTSQKASGGQSAVGYATLDVVIRNDARVLGVPQLNRVKFFLGSSGANFSSLGEMTIPRDRRVERLGGDNPLAALYRL